jgi:hypothetical protein
MHLYRIFKGCFHVFQKFEKKFSLQSLTLKTKKHFINFEMKLLFFILLKINGGCRVITYSHKLAALLVSQPSNNPIFPGYGVKKVGLLFIKIKNTEKL